jgi:hypothetical protein
MSSSHPEELAEYWACRSSSKSVCKVCRQFCTPCTPTPDQYEYTRKNFRPLSSRRHLHKPRRASCADSPRNHPATLLGPHVTGDWSNLSPGDIKTNRDAVAGGARVLSSYRIAPPRPEMDRTRPRQRRRKSIPRDASQPASHIGTRPLPRRPDPRIRTSRIAFALSDTANHSTIRTAIV